MNVKNLLVLRERLRRSLRQCLRHLNGAALYHTHPNHSSGNYRLNPRAKLDHWRLADDQRLGKGPEAGANPKNQSRCPQLI